MWYLVKDLLLILLGVGIGIMMIALVQAAGNADRRMEEKWRNEK